MSEDPSYSVEENKDRQRIELRRYGQVISYAEYEPGARQGEVVVSQVFTPPASRGQGTFAAAHVRYRPERHHLLTIGWS